MENLPTGRTFEVDRAENGWVLRVYLNPPGTSQTHICAALPSLLACIERVVGEIGARAERDAIKEA